MRIKYLSATGDVTARPLDEAAFPPAATLREVVAWLSDRYNLAAPGPGVMAILNGTGWGQLPLGLATELREGDVIALFPPIAGG